MTITTFKIAKGSKAQEQKPFVRIGYGQGCGLEGCHCSDGYWVSVSDGKTGILTKFDSKEEFDKYISNQIN